LNDDVDKQIAQMKIDSKKSVDEICDLLLKHTGEVDTSVHKNKEVKA
jgi:hypothetical protein